MKRKLEVKTLTKGLAFVPGNRSSIRFVRSELPIPFNHQDIF